MRVPSGTAKAPCLVALALAMVLALTASEGLAADAARERQLTPEEIDAWLDSRSMPRSQSDQSAADGEDAPPPLPRKHGFVLESSVGVLGHIGPMKNIAPNAPWFAVRFGYEPLRWLMVFAEADLFVATTSYAHPPPPPRSFAFWGLGAGARVTLKPMDRFGIYLQGSLGGGRATEDVLEVYGYPNAEELNLFQTAELGFEWYQVSPHLALALHGGVRNYQQGLKRLRSSDPPLAWLSGLALRYTF